ncbi:hypothetical protein [Streptomyces sp. NPDC052225]|uniref:hypothetical protein n=1 Tax=Streptomyces sp. NPDC052225 TaxID=3154949 RepID=UPI00344A89D3
MADEHYKWLDREAAERLLRGEPLKAVVENAAHAEPASASAHSAAADSASAGSRYADEDLREAERLVAALDSLTALRAGADGELPGEDAALKAFRDARAVSAVDGAVGGTVDGAAGSGRHRRHRAGAPAAPARGPRWGRPVRFGLAAVVAACMVGGVAVAAGTGVLPSPFGGRDEPAPATSVSAASPDQPLASPSPGATGGDKPETDGSERPDDASGSPDAGGGGGGGDDAHGSGPSASADPRASEGDTGAAPLRRRLVEACLKYRGGNLSSDERRRLQDSANKAGRSTADLDRFCDRTLGQSDSGSEASPDSKGGDSGSGSGGKTGGQDGDEDDDNGRGGGRSDQNVGFGLVRPAAPTPTRSYSASPELPTATPSASPSTSAS